MPRIQYRLSPDAPEETMGFDAELTIGRRSRNTLAINDGSISRYHSRIEKRSDGYYLIDLSSKNGSRVNGEPLSGPHPLHDGDVIRTGKFDLTFREDRPAAAGAGVGSPATAPPPRPAARRGSTAASRRKAFLMIVVSCLLMIGSIPFWTGTKPLPGWGSGGTETIYDLGRPGAAQWVDASRGRGIPPPSARDLACATPGIVRWSLLGVELPDAFRIEGSITRFSGDGALRLAIDPGGVEVRFHEGGVSLVGPGVGVRELRARVPFGWTLDRRDGRYRLKVLSGDGVEIPLPPGDGARSLRIAADDCTFEIGRLEIERISE